MRHRSKRSPKISQQSRLAHELNPSAQWTAGEAIKVPDVEPFSVPAPADKPAAKATAGTKPAPSALEVVISGANKSLTVREPAARF